MTQPRPAEVVAHRGYARCFPENTLLAVQAAIELGARYIEVDVQCSSDGIPVVVHDETLARTAGLEKSVVDLPLERLRTIDVGERPRFGDRFAGTTVPTLDEMARTLGGHPDVTLFVELKPASVQRFGRSTTVDRVVEALGDFRGQCVLLCCDEAVLPHARDAGLADVGWVLPSWSEANRVEAETLAPGYLFCNLADLPERPVALWPGPWRWAIYEVDRIDVARDLVDRGVELIETMAIGEFLRDDAFARVRHG